MLLRLRQGLAPHELRTVIDEAGRQGATVRFLDDARTLAELEGPFQASARARFEDLWAVVSILDAKDAPELHQTVRPGAGGVDTIEAGHARFGGGDLSIVAGPCAVEDRDALLEIARHVADAGATLLRGGAYKPRTSPHAFQGLGEAGLALLDEARALTGLGIVTEVLDPRDVEKVGAVADVFQIGARSMANSALLTEVGRYSAEHGTPVLVKRGIAASVRELLLAAEYVLNEGTNRVILCERGIRSFDNVTRNLLDLGAVAHLKGATHLPVVVDPSHAAGRADLVLPLGLAAVAAGADGLLVEVNPRPETTHSDGAQALSPSAFVDLVRRVEALAQVCGRRVVRVAREAV
ncbi:Phospho-2-dehydro-3-deoxyheptonate aldolase [Planctomycetes bacterium Pla163]|uniref:Phospho-2-dehydro-3-deoxyheptonate aldolase n=1 Tax=Rohdeia mirabilis TaxID=2528008 RepID=A0A518D464_9BACT|nr:Phospho-2-dehydro-3-deoxyheptonate aldolase [Planctomycetes bacterium Pla163]